MKTIRIFSLHAQRLLLACLIVTALVLSGLRYWLLPRAEQWRGELQTAIGNMIGERVQIRSISAEMRGLKPEVSLRGFRIETADTTSPAVEFDRLGVGLNLPQTLWSGQPVIDSIDLEGAHLRLTRAADGGVTILGLKPGGKPLWLFAEGEVRLTDIDLEWLPEANGSAIGLGRTQIRIRNQKGQHLVDVRMDLPGKLGKSLRLAAALQGDMTRPETCNGRVYVEAKRLREGASVDLLPLRLVSGEAGFQAWSEWRQGTMSDIKARIDLDRPVFTWKEADGSNRMFGIDKLGGWLRWQREPNGWQLAVKDFEFADKQRSWPKSDYALGIAYKPDGSLESVRTSARYLRLDDLQGLLLSLPLVDESFLDLIKDLAPKGEIANGHMAYHVDGAYGFCGELTGVGFNSMRGLPSLPRISGHLCGNDRVGLLELKSASGSLALPGLYQTPLTLNQLAGNFRWKRIADTKDGNLSAQPPAGDAWLVTGNGINLRLPGLSADGGFALELPSTPQASPIIDMQFKLWDVDAFRLRDYLPLAAMSEGSAQWLREAFDNGKLTQVEAKLRGRLEDFPFNEGEGLFEVQVEAENMELDFHQEWPHLYGVNAKILIFGTRMFIDSEGGRIGEIPLSPTHAQTTDFIGDGWMDITSHVDTDLAQAMKFLQTTPTRHIPDRLLKVATPAGPAQLDLNLSIPMTFGLGDVGVQGQVRLQGAGLALKESQLALQDLNGDLDFDRVGMRGTAIGGTALGEPVLIDVDQQQGNIRLDISGKARTDALRTAFVGGLWNFAEGEFNYRVNLRFPDSLNTASAPMHIGLASDLIGLKINLPAPLAKHPQTKKDLDVELELRKGGRSSLALEYGNDLHSRLVFSNNDGYRLEDGDLAIGKPLPSSGAPGFGLFLKLDELDLGLWRKILEPLGQGASVSALPHGLDVQIGKLIWDGEDLGPAWLAGKLEAGEFFGEMDWHYAKGSFAIAYPEFAHAQVKLNLENLLVPKLASGTPDHPPDPLRLPALQVRARHVVYQGHDLGILELDAERWTAGLNFKRLALRTENHQLNLKGSWMRLDGHDETKFEGKLKVNDLGNLLSLLDYDREILETPTEAVFDLSWSGAPHQYSARTMAGSVNLKLGRGRVLQMEPGLGRALGMLNLQTLRRLLLLDFSDLFGQGLAYDGMEGIFQLGDGQARTKGFMVDAVAADILLIGRVGLVNHDFEQIISVIPHTLASIPLAGAIVGRAALGTVVDLAHRLLGAEDMNLDSANYSVTGSWDNPQIKRAEGSMAMDIIQRAWSDFKEMSGWERKSGRGND